MVDSQSGSDRDLTYMTLDNLGIMTMRQAMQGLTALVVAPRHLCIIQFQVVPNFRIFGNICTGTFVGICLCNPISYIRCLPRVCSLFTFMIYHFAVFQMLNHFTTAVHMASTAGKPER